jgi:hypothetical protein
MQLPFFPEHLLKEFPLLMQDLVALPIDMGQQF